MNQVHQINLDRQQFAIAHDAETSLQTYLTAIAKAVDNDEETIREIEVRIAELLTSKGAGGSKVVIKADIDYVRHQLGEPTDFSDAEQAEKVATVEEVAPKKLYRDTDSALIGGVAAGLGRFSGVNVWIFRISFIVLTSFRGIGVALYLLLWLFVPAAKNAADRLTMAGKPVTAENLRQLVARADIAETGRRTSRVIGKGLERLAGYVVTLFGLGLTIAGVAAIFGTIMVLSYLIPNGLRASNIRLFPVEVSEYVLLIIAGIGGLALALLLVTAGLTVIQRKQVVRNWLQVLAASLVVVSASVGGAMAVSIAPNVQDRAHALHRNESRTLPAFETLKLSGPNTTYVLEPSDTYSMTVNYVGNYAPEEVAVKASGTELTIDASRLSTKRPCHSLCLYGSTETFITVHAPSFQNIQVVGDNVALSSNRPFSQPQLRVTVANNSRFDFIHTTADNLDLSIDVQTGDVTALLTNARPQSGDTSLAYNGYSGGLTTFGIQNVNLTSITKCRIDNPLLIATKAEVLRMNGTEISQERLDQNYQAYQGLSAVAPITESAENCIVEFKA